MSISRFGWIKLKQALVIGLAGAFLGFIYTLGSDGFILFYPHLNGLIGGFIMGFTLTLIEIYLFPKFLKKWRFVPLLSIRVLTYLITLTVIMLLVLNISRSQRMNTDFLTALTSVESIDYMLYEDFKYVEFYAFIIALVFNFIRLFSIKLGYGILADFILGRYAKPKIVNRVFCFINITKAQDILINKTVTFYHQYINDILIDITRPIIENNGFIYEYVDDQVVIYWKSLSGWERNFRSFLSDLKKAINGRKKYYLEKYDHHPDLKFAFHEGEVVQGEIGEIKTEIVFQGDTLNTTARIIEIASSDNVLFSESIYNITKNSLEDNKIKSLGRVYLKGKEDPINIYSFAQD